MFGLKRVGKNRPPPQLRWPWRACLRVLQPRCGNKLEKEAADLEKAAVAARKKVKEAKAKEAAFLNATATDSAEAFRQPTAKASGVAAAKQPQGKRRIPKRRPRRPLRPQGRRLPQLRLRAQRRSLPQLRLRAQRRRLSTGSELRLSHRASTIVTQPRNQRKSREGRKKSQRGRRARRAAPPAQTARKVLQASAARSPSPERAARAGDDAASAARSPRPAAVAAGVAVAVAAAVAAGTAMAAEAAAGVAIAAAAAAMSAIAAGVATDARRSRRPGTPGAPVTAVAAADAGEILERRRSEATAWKSTALADKAAALRRSCGSRLGRHNTHRHSGPRRKR